MIRLLIADDHPIVREGLKQILSKDGDIVVAGEAETCAEVLEKIAGNNYDLVLLDVNMPDRLGLDILDEIKSIRPKLPVLILSAYPEEQYAISALKSGAFGYIVKKSAPKELVTAIRRVGQGMKYVSSSLAERLADYVEEKNVMPHERLSSRERQVMLMLSSGRKMTEISKELALSLNTISTYRSRILEKMGMKRNVELITYAIKHGLLNISEPEYNL